MSKPLDVESWDRFKEELTRRAKESSLDDLERICREHNPDPEAGRGTDSWYAFEILTTIRFVRHFLERGEQDMAVEEAVNLGVLAGSWPPARKAAKISQRMSEIGQKGGTLTAARADELREQVEDRAVRIRRKMPYDRAKRSQRWLAEKIAKSLNKPTETVRGHLKALGIR